MGKGSRSRRKKKRAVERDNSKDIRKHALKHPSTDLWGYNTLPLGNDLPENINFVVK